MKAHALIIDDNAANILVMQQLLQMEGVASATLSAPQRLTQKLDELTDVDVVFLDLEMPIVNGYEALEIIRAHPHFQNSKVIAYSVHVSEINAAMDGGFDGFLGKPLDAEAFSEQLDRILQGEKVFYLP